MEKQTLVLTALPNGFTPDGTARVSVFIAPRLWSDAPGAGNLQLSQYPDLLQWPSRVAALAWEASLDGAPAVPLAPDGNPLNPALWPALFHATTQVKPFRFEDYRGMPIETFPIGAVHDTIAGLYGKASADPLYGAGRERPDLGVLAADTDLAAIARPSFPEPEPQWDPLETAAVPFPDAPPVTEKPEPEPELPVEPPMPSCCCGCGCLAWPWRLLRKLFGGGDAKAPTSPTSPTSPSSQPAATPSFKTDVTPPPPPVPPGPGKSFLPPPLTPAQQQTRAAFDALDAFLKPFEGAAPELPKTEADLAETWDFHQAVSSLGDYPAILRRLGLVVDLLLPPGTVLPAAGTIRVAAAGVAWQPGTTIVAPRTHFVATAALFTAAPRPAQPEIADGFLRVDDTARFRVIQNDVPGDAVKLRHAATHFLRFALPADRPGNLPGEGGLPALRTAGISLIRVDVAAELAGQFQRSCALNRFLAAQDLSPEPPPAAPAALPAPSDEMYAEDLVRGYRIDVFDTKTAAWRSLCERTGTYRFLEAAGGPLTEAAADEGFVQLAATEPRDPAAPKSLRIGETLFTWNGWSLAAPRPGKAIMTDDSHAEPPNPAVTPFKIETEFKAKTGSLPRLRFGRRYRLRARVADLAGNSVTNPGEDAFDVDVPASTPTTPEITAVRYEPLAPPVLMLRSAPVEGESVERLVIRTPAIGGLGALTARHVAPPKASQLMAELHGKLDGATVDGSPAGYALAARESNSVQDGAQQTRPAVDGNPGVVPPAPAESDPWIQPDPLLTVTYLPDPQARGVALTGLPGELVPGAVRRVDFGSAWPDLKPFRLDLVPIPAGTLPAEPVLAGGVLTVELAPAQRATVRINSVIDPADLGSRGVWKWTGDLAPANLGDVEDSVLEGRHWAHLPWRDITLVHAVQKPLAAPAIAALSPKKMLGDTFAEVTGDVAVDAPSTARVQLLARWTDPVDDPAAPAPGSQTREAHVCEIEVPAGASPVGVIDSSTGNPPRHELHDTKYHRVDYTPVAVTRFREYFPAATNTPAATTERGADQPAEVKSSARPDAPKLLYALPLFEWDTPPGTPGVTHRSRSGGGLRLYLDRPWFSSGEGELLGVVYQDGVGFLDLDEELKRFVTQWGADPVWDAHPAPVHAEESHFQGSQKPLSGPLLAEHPATVSVVGYPVAFDAVRRLWSADIRIETAGAYWPFVRLALARYQPNSVDWVHLSRIERADFIQLPPRRDAKIAAGPAAVHLEVDGPVHVGSEVIRTLGETLPVFGGSPDSNGFSEIEAVIERRDPAEDPANELAWTAIESTRVVLFQNPLAPGHWEGDVTLSEPLAPGLFRLTLKELEWFRTDDAGSADTPREEIRVARRVVYADVFAL